MTIKTKTTNIEDTAKIKVLAKSNPRREGTRAHKLFSLYRTGMTFAEYKAAVLALKGVRPRRARSSLVTDLRRGSIALVPAQAKKAGGAKAAKAA